MNKQRLESRLRELTTLRDRQRLHVLDLEASLAAARQNLATIEGGIQDCRWWASQAPEAAAPGSGSAANDPSIDESKFSD